VIGHPVSHSLSPDIFGFLAGRLKRSLIYRKLDILPEELSEITRKAQTTALFRGWNVTIPHKTALAGLCSDLSPAAKAMGAVNVVEFRKRGARGHNTDVIGIRETLREQRFKARARGAVIYGAGGAALAVGYVLGELGAGRVVLQARNLAKARAAASRLGRIFRKTRYEATTKATGPFDLYVNATPLGMQGFAENRLLARDARRGALAFDLIYRPEKTSFLASARRRGLRTVGGLDMLIWQAIGTWEVWFGPLRGKAPVKAALARHLRTTCAGLNSF
jgi:shikimate dehydrogenase